MLKVMNTIEDNAKMEDFSWGAHIFQYITFLVGTLLMILGFYMLMNKNLHTHPYPLMGVACLALAAQLLQGASIKFLFSVL